MTLADLLDTEEAKPIRRGGTCTIARILDRLPDADAESLRAAFDSEMTGEAISRALRAAGHTVRAGTVNRHRRRLCRCDD